MPSFAVRIYAIWRPDRNATQAGTSLRHEPEINERAINGDVTQLDRSRLPVPDGTQLLYKDCQKELNAGSRPHNGAESTQQPRRRLRQPGRAGRSPKSYSRTPPPAPRPPSPNT